MRITKIGLVAGLLLTTSPLAAQVPPWTRPSVNSSGTIAVTNTFQSLWANNQARSGCTVQNNSARTMYVFFGPIANATLVNSVVLAAGQSANCGAPSGVVLRDQVSITGTATDAFFAAAQ